MTLNWDNDIISNFREGFIKAGKEKTNQIKHWQLTLPLSLENTFVFCTNCTLNVQGQYFPDFLYKVQIKMLLRQRGECCMYLRWVSVVLVLVETGWLCSTLRFGSEAELFLWRCCSLPRPYVYMYCKCQVNVGCILQNCLLVLMHASGCFVVYYLFKYTTVITVTIVFPFFNNSCWGSLLCHIRVPVAKVQPLYKPL